MPVLLPGLEGLVAGVTSGTDQMAQRENNILQSFLSNTQALGVGVNMNDDFEFRRGFAASDAGTPMLERFDTAINNTSNPYVGIQALLAQQSASMPLAQRAAQDAAFAAAQGIPQSFEDQLQRQYFGVNPLLQDRANQQRLTLLQQAPSLNNNTFADAFNSANASAGINSATYMALQEANRRGDVEMNFAKYQADTDAKFQAVMQENAKLRGLLSQEVKTPELPADLLFQNNQD